MRSIAKESEENLKALEQDYAHMKSMIFGPKPPFAEILETIAELENEIHGVARK